MSQSTQSEFCLLARRQRAVFTKVTKPMKSQLHLKSSSQSPAFVSDRLPYDGEEEEKEDGCVIALPMSPQQPLQRFESVSTRL